MKFKMSKFWWESGSGLGGVWVHIKPVLKECLGQSKDFYSHI